MILEHTGNLFFYSSFGFLMSSLLFFTLAGMAEPGDRNKNTIRRLQDVAGLNLALMVLCVFCWGLAEIFLMWVK